MLQNGDLISKRLRMEDIYMHTAGKVRVPQNEGYEDQQQSTTEQKIHHKAPREQRTQ